MNGKFIVKILCSACILQVILTVYFIIKIFVSPSIIRPDQIAPILNADDYDEPNSEFKSHHLQKLETNQTIEKVEVIGRAAIGIFLWEHILEGSREVDEENPSLYMGNLALPEAIFLYREGPGLQPELVNLRSRFVILVVNGRNEEKISESRKWLDHLHTNQENIRILLVALGNEQCDNSWMQTYMSPKGKVRGVFLVYDDPVVDGSTYYQWPLGVATYRHFPILTEEQIRSAQPRKYLCNLQATNHANGTRNQLFRFLLTQKSNCLVKERSQWQENESEESMREYISGLTSSDLTVCPSGFNTETYRVYEALAAGSVPVIEDVASKGNCDSSTGWRLLKQFKPPVIWIKSWKELGPLLEKEKEMTDLQKVMRRKRLLNWFEWFKLRLKDRFVSVVESKLLKPD